jgi:hypothetical protein
MQYVQIVSIIKWFLGICFVVRILEIRTEASMKQALAKNFYEGGGLSDRTSHVCGIETGLVSGDKLSFDRNRSYGNRNTGYILFFNGISRSGMD